MKNKPLHLLTTADCMSKKQLKKFRIQQQKMHEQSKKQSEKLENYMYQFNKLFF